MFAYYQMINMANDNMSSPIKAKNFSLHATDMNAIKLLNNQNHIVYDGIRIKWTNDLCSLQNCIENVVGLTGKWHSHGGGAKRFTDSNNSKLIMTWYPGKQNTLTFNGKEGESFKKILVSILDTNCVIKQTNTVHSKRLQKHRPQTTTSCSVDNNLAAKDLASLTDRWSFNTHAKDMDFDSIVDDSTFEELEDFINSAYHIANVGAALNFARAIGISTPLRTDDNRTVVEEQLFAFKEKEEIQIEKLLTIVKTIVRTKSYHKHKYTRAMSIKE